MARIDRNLLAYSAHSEVDAYNAAFDELGLSWHWDEAVMQQLAPIQGESERIAEYLRRHHPHLLTAYPVEFLASAITNTKARYAAPGR
jgi:hypothetical protein